MTELTTTEPVRDLRARYRDAEGEFLFTGVQALVRIPFDVLRRDRLEGHNTAAFVSGYQGSPLGTFDLEMSRQRDLASELGVTFRPGVNEELAATAVMGSQMIESFPDPTVDGVFGLWYGKAPGLDRATDALRHASYGGTARMGGAIAAVGDDPAAKSSTLPSSSEALLHDLSMTTFVPGNPQEVLDLGRHAAAVSRISGLWSAMRVVTAVADGTSRASVSPDRFVPVTPSIEHDGVVWTPRPQKGHMAYHSVDAQEEIVEIRLELARRYVEVNSGINTVSGDSDAWIGVVASGRVYYEVVEALSTLGLGLKELSALGIRLLRLGVVSPLDTALVRSFATGLEEIVVVEEGGPFLEPRLRDALYGTTDPPRVLGRTDEAGNRLIAGHGAHVADALTGPLRRRLERRIPTEKLRRSGRGRSIKVTAIGADTHREPYFCSGCPHNTSAQVPDGTLVGAGIGCHSMVSLMDESRVGEVVGITQMGGEGAQWIGMSPFVGTRHIVQNLGDGTLFHSGSLAIRAAVAARSNITFKILYNSAVAMTGGQEAEGAMSVADLAKELRLEGVQRIIITSDDTARYRSARLRGPIEVWDRSRVVEAQEVLRTVDGVTVLIHDQQCAAELRRDRKRGLVEDPPMRVVINERVCEGCGDCGEVSNCLSVQPVETEFGRKTRIDQSSCNKDYSCLDGDCPSFLTLEPAPTRPSWWPWRVQSAVPPISQEALPVIAPADLPDPDLVVPDDDVIIRMPGIGGTGVVTVSQVLGTAAVLDGKQVQGLDQTGFSQKAGAVVSDLRISTKKTTGTNQAPRGRVDVYLVFDLLVALADKNLEGADPSRTVLVASTSPTPTGSMVTNVDAPTPEVGAMLEEVRNATRTDVSLDIDVVQLATRLFGGSLTSNIILVGAAHQLGCIPISAVAIERAIEMNGAAVEANRLAFRWGRLLAHDRERVLEIAASREASTVPNDPVPMDLGDLDRGELGRLLGIRVPELIRFQDHAYAQRYLALVRRAATAEHQVDPSSSKLAEAVAASYFKLMAYKDEYEVARLHAEGSAAAAHEVGPGMRVSYNLHPPMFRAMGMRDKIRIGPWAGSLLRLLARGKRLRGTRLDPFGYAKVRRIERSLVHEYCMMMDEAFARLTPETLPAIIELAGLPDMIRGYEDIKLDNVARYRAEITRIRGQVGL